MSDHLVVIAVTGTSYTLVDYLSPIAIPKNRPMVLKTGDKVAWSVQVYSGNQRFAPPYELSFIDFTDKTPDSRYFGRNALSVPGGGTSAFLPVLAFQGHIKYTVTIPGLTTIDPEMQTGEGTGIRHDPAAKTYTITWDIDRNTMSYSGGLLPPDGLQIADGNSIVFKATSKVIDPAPNIQIAFAPNSNRWASPFNSSNGNVPFSGYANPTGSVPVLDDTVDQAGASFTFTAQTEDGNHTSLPNILKF